MYEKPRHITIEDMIFPLENSPSQAYAYEATFVLGKQCTLNQIEKNQVMIQTEKSQLSLFTGNHSMEIEPLYFSEKYGVLDETLCIKIRGKEEQNKAHMVTVIEINE